MIISTFSNVVTGHAVSDGTYHLVSRVDTGWKLETIRVSNRTTTIDPAASIYTTVEDMLNHIQKKTKVYMLRRYREVFISEVKQGVRFTHEDEIKWGALKDHIAL